MHGRSGNSDNRSFHLLQHDRVTGSPKETADSCSDSSCLCPFSGHGPEQRVVGAILHRVTSRIGSMTSPCHRNRLAGFAAQLSELFCSIRWCCSSQTKRTPPSSLTSIQTARFYESLFLAHEKHLMNIRCFEQETAREVR